MNVTHRIKNEPRQDTIWSFSIDALRHLIVGNATTLEGEETNMLSLIYCLKSQTETRSILTGF